MGEPVKSDSSGSKNLSPEMSVPAEKSIVKKKSGIKLGLIVVLIGLFFLVVLSAIYYFFSSRRVLILPEPEPNIKTTPTRVSSDITPAPIIAQGKFAQFPKVSVEIKANFPDYEIDSEFSNVINFADFENLSNSAQSKLFENGFVITPGFRDEFFPLYESNVYKTNKYPSFITTDSVVHSYHLLFDYLLRTLEKEKLFQLLQQVNQEMVGVAKAQVDQFQGTEWENAALRNLGFFSVAGRLLDDSFAVPDEVIEEVEKELELIEKREGIALSPVMNRGIIDASGEIINPVAFPSEDEVEGFKEDYTQYIPRGHYEKSELLKRYFKAMMWYGRMTFRFKSDDEIRSAVLLSSALSSQTKAFSAWEAIYEVTSFFVGKSDDIGFYELGPEIEAVYGKNASKDDFLAKGKFDQLKDKFENLEPPKVNSMPIYQANVQPDRETEIKGYRFMGQRFTVDASIFQQLVYREVGDKTKTCADFDPEQTGCLKGARCLPKGLDIPAAMGSEEALRILGDQKETDYACYPENLNRLKNYISGLDESIWTQNLYWGWLYSLLPLTDDVTGKSGYPLFMKNKAWLRKQLNAYLGSWTELKHDTILYAKQVYAEMGAGGFEPEEKDDRGFVEPMPLVYARLAGLTKMTREGLKSRNLLDGENEETLKIMEELCLRLKTIAEKELNNKLPTDEEFEFIRGYGGDLEHLFMKAMRDECQNMNATNCLNDNPAALVADVATDPNGRVLEEAIGKIYPIYVVVPVEGKLRIARGGVFSYYEFPWPMSDRLTDSKWRKMVDEKETPERPAWTQSFMAE